MCILKDCDNIVQCLLLCMALIYYIMKDLAFVVMSSTQYTSCETICSASLSVISLGMRNISQLSHVGCY